jgi:hypothetical protein
LELKESYVDELMGRFRRITLPVRKRVSQRTPDDAVRCFPPRFDVLFAAVEPENWLRL